MAGSPSIPKTYASIFGKTSINRVEWDRRVHNLEMSATYLETCILGMDMGQTNVIEISKYKATQS